MNNATETKNLKKLTFDNAFFLEKSQTYSFNFLPTEEYLV